MLSHTAQIEVNGVPVVVHFDHTHAEPSNGIGESYDITAVFLQGVDIFDIIAKDNAMSTIVFELEKRRAA